jgi:hypothetical protein
MAASFAWTAPKGLPAEARAVTVAPVDAAIVAAILSFETFDAKSWPLTD